LNNGRAAIPELPRRRFLSRKDALNDGDNRLVAARCLRNAGRFGVHRGDVTEQVTHFPVAEDVKVGKGKEQGFTNSEGCQAFDVYPTDLASWAFHWTGSLSRH